MITDSIVQWTQTKSSHKGNDVQNITSSFLRDNSFTQSCVFSGNFPAGRLSPQILYLHLGASPLNKMNSMSIFILWVITFLGSFNVLLSYLLRQSTFGFKNKFKNSLLKGLSKTLSFTARWNEIYKNIVYGAKSNFLIKITFFLLNMLFRKQFSKSNTGL